MVVAVTGMSGFHTTSFVPCVAILHDLDDIGALPNVVETNFWIVHMMYEPSTWHRFLPAHFSPNSYVS